MEIIDAIKKIIKIFLILFFGFFIVVEIVIFLTNQETILRYRMIIERVEIIGFSILSSFIFYLVVVKLKEIKDRKNIRPYIAQKVGGIIKTHIEQIKDLKLLDLSKYRHYLEREDLEREDFFPGKDKIHEIFKKIKPDEIFYKKIGGQELNFLQYLNQKSLWIEKLTKDLFKISSVIDTDLIKIIYRIEDHQYIKEIRYFSRYDVRSENLLFMTNFFISFQEEIIKLNEYFERKLKKYYKNLSIGGDYLITDSDILKN